MSNNQDELLAILRNILEQGMLSGHKYLESNGLEKSAEAITKWSQRQVLAGRIDELKRWQYPYAPEMIPRWKWPCYICGFDAEKLSNAQEDRIAELKAERGV